VRGADDLGASPYISASYRPYDAHLRNLPASRRFDLRGPDRHDGCAGAGR